MRARVVPEVYIKMTCCRPKTNTIQCTTWRDKKQVIFLSSNKVGASHGLTVKRRVRGKQEQLTIPEPHAHAKYVESMNGVDRNDHDSADYLTSIWTNHYYCSSFAGHWIGLYMRCMLLCAS